MTSFIADAASYDTAGRALAEASADLARSITAFVGSVSDVAAFGTNDLLGAVCSEVYRVAYDACHESAGSVALNFDDIADQLVAAGRVYREVEEAQVSAAATMINPGTVG